MKFCSSYEASSFAPGIELPLFLGDLQSLLLRTDHLFRVALHVAVVREEDVLTIVLVDLGGRVATDRAGNIGQFSSPLTRNLLIKVEHERRLKEALARRGLRP